MNRMTSIFARTFRPMIGGAGVDPKAIGAERASRYKALRSRGMTAADAFHAATETDKRLPAAEGPGLGAPWDSGSTTLRWVENPAALGLRFVGYADEIAPRRIDHTGWFNRDNDDWNKLRGAVWRLPRGRLIPGYVELEGESRLNGEAGALAFGEIVREVGGCEFNDNAQTRDAASRADSIAAYAAEDQRDHDRAYQRGAKAAREIMGAKDTASDALALVADMRARFPKGERKGPVWEALVAKLEEHRDAMREAREGRESAWSDTSGYLEESFRAGYVDESDAASWNAFARGLNLRTFNGEAGNGLLTVQP